MTSLSEEGREDEEPTPLEGPSLDIVLDLAEDGTSYRAVSECIMHRDAYMDFLNKCSLPDIPLIFSNPVPVFGLDDETIVGYASLSWVDDQVTADCTIRYDSQERLLLQAGDPISAIFALTPGYGWDSGPVVEIFGLTLSTSRLLDSRNRPLKGE